MESRTLLSTVALDFDGGAGGINNTGFTQVLASSRTQPLVSGGVNIGAGQLWIRTTNGDLTTNNQTNALGVSADLSAGFDVQTRVSTLPFSRTCQNGGVYVAIDENNYVKLVVGFNGVASVEMGGETSGAFSDTAKPAVRFRGYTSYDLRLIGNSSNGTITAQYRSNVGSTVGAWVTVGTRSARNLFTTSAKAGVISTNIGTGPITVGFDSFTLQTYASTRHVGTSGVANVDIAPVAGNQEEAKIAINPANPRNMVAVSMDENSKTAQIMVSRTFDGGATWSTTWLSGRTDGLAMGNPRLDAHGAFDAFGNLYVCYIVANSIGGINVMTAISKNGGSSFYTTTTAVGGQHANSDAPSITTGVDATNRSRQLVAITYANEYHQRVEVSYGTSGGLGNFSGFTGWNTISDGPGNYSSVAIGPNGEVGVVWQTPESGTSGPATIYANVDRDGLGSRYDFGGDLLVARINVGGMDSVLAQPNRGIDAEPGLAFDNSNDSTRGRMVVVYVDRLNKSNKNDTDILSKYSDTFGGTWSPGQIVNCDDTTNSQFNPALAIDPISGLVGVSWLDARNSAGDNTVQQFAAVSTDHGENFPTDFQVSRGTSSQAGAQIGGTPYGDYDFGDVSGVAFYNRTLVPVWADNSNSTGKNPDGTGRRLDLYSAIIHV